MRKESISWAVGVAAAVAAWMSGKGIVALLGIVTLLFIRILFGRILFETLGWEKSESHVSRKYRFLLISTIVIPLLCYKLWLLSGPAPNWRMKLPWMKLVGHSGHFLGENIAYASGRTAEILILKGFELPVEAKCLLKTRYNNQRTIDMDILAGNSMAVGRDRLLGRFVSHKLSLATAGESECQVAVYVSTQGAVSVSEGGSLSPEPAFLGTVAVK